MKKVISFKSDRKHYNADACIVWCFDNRFGDLLSKFKKKFGLRYTDDLEVAGGAMNLVGYGSGENNWTHLLKDDLNTAKIALAEYLETNGYKPNIQTYIAGFDGLWEV